MGYFSNGSEGEHYEQKWCDRCIHGDYGINKEGATHMCPVWLAHFVHNYDECNNDNSILHMLIPRDGSDNGQCKMFIEQKDA